MLVGVSDDPPHLRVHVDPDRCQGHNRCYSLAPELFDIDDLGTSHEKGDGTVPPELEEKAQRAVANCPEYAISISSISSISEAGSAS
jgi:ferredoxin